MYPIEIRAWDKVVKKMYSSENVGYDCEYAEYSLRLNVDDDDDRRWNLKDEDLIVTQYTGIKDKNEIKLFDRDMVKFDEYVCDIRWYQYGWFMFFKQTGKDKKESWLTLAADMPIHPFKDGRLPDKNNKLEKIGNMFENGELMNAAS